MVKFKRLTVSVIINTYIAVRKLRVRCELLHEPRQRVVHFYNAVGTVNEIPIVIIISRWQVKSVAGYFLALVNDS